MPGRHLYEFAAIRLLPVLARGEFLNVGVILLGQRAGYVGVRTLLDEQRLRAFRNEADMDQVRASLHAFELVARGDPAGGPIARLPPAERFRWLTAARSTAIQASPVHAGLCSDLEATTERLFRELVL